MRPTPTVVALLAATCAHSAPAFEWAEDAGRGTLTLRDAQTPVLTYVFGDQLKEGVPAQYTRSCYIHPLYDLDGQALTDDFPRDHRHHRGVFWTWPRMKARGKPVQTWHPCNPPLRQCFVRWLKREATAQAAALSVQNEWRLADERVASTTVTLVAYPTDDVGRAIDVTLTFEAVGGPVELLGAKKKGYGGLCVRGAPNLKGCTITTEQGVLKKDSVNKTFQWSDMSTGDRGVAVLVRPDHPDFPPTWLVRSSYAGILNASWPGLKPFTLEPGKPVTLGYRLYVHRGDAVAGRVAQAYAAYCQAPCR